MRDYTINNYCDFLWIGDLLELKKNSKNMFQAKLRKNNRTFLISFVNVIIFGTISEIRQIGVKQFLYHVDDGTGVIACKLSEEQFEEAINTIEREHEDVLNQTFQNQESQNRSYLTDTSADDSIFNEKSIQDDELGILKKDLLNGLQTMWNDIYNSFTNLLAQFEIGETVLIEGKLYSYFDSNQIYVNSIRRMTLNEEIMKISMKLKDGCDAVGKDAVREVETKPKRWSGLMTFDNVHHLNAMVPPTRDIRSPVTKFSVDEGGPDVVLPNPESAMTFDTFNGNC